jgi:tetratricopeptide (TPR) repeat protein
MNRHNVTPWLLALTCLWSVAGSVSGQEVGDSIVIKTYQSSLRAEHGSTATVTRGDILGVLKVEPNRFYARLWDGRNRQAEGWINRGDVLALSAALAIFDDELKRSQTAEGYAIRGEIQGHLKEYDKAIADFEEAIRRDPKQARFYSLRGAARSHKHQEDHAIADFTEAIRLDPEYATAYVRRAFSWREKGKYDKAMADCNEALRINPKFAVGHAARATVWISGKQFGLAISDCGEAIRLDPNLAAGYATRGYAWQLKADYAKAIADYDAAIRLNPKTSKWFLNRGVVCAETEDYEQALADCDTAIRLDRKDFSALSFRAWLTATCSEVRYRDPKRSLQDAKKACELSDWKAGKPLEALAAAYAENGDFFNAVKWQKKALELVPENEPWQRPALDVRLRLYQSQQPYHGKRPSD